MSKKTKGSYLQLWTILAIVFFGFLGLSIPYLVFPSLFLNPEYAIIPAEWSEARKGLMLGITLSAYPFGQFFGSPILGALSDDYGRRRIMTVSLLVTCVCSFISAFSIKWKMIGLLIGSRFSAGLMEGNLAIARAMAADLKEFNKHDTFGKINAAASMSFILGPIIGGVLSDKTIYKHFSVTVPFFLICFLFFLLSIVSHFAIKERRKPLTGTKRSILERINFIGRLRRLFKNKTLKLLLIVVTLYTLAVDMFFEFGPVFLTAVWKLSPIELVGYNVLISVAIALSCAYLAGYLAMRYPNLKILLWSILTFSISLIGIVTTSSPWMMGAVFISLGIAIGVASTNLTVQVSDSVSDEIQGEVLGVQTSLRVLGDALICVAGGATLVISPSLVLISAAVIAFGLLCYLFFRNKSALVS